MPGISRKAFKLRWSFMILVMVSIKYSLLVFTISVFRKILQMLQECYRDNFCKNYCIPDINLIDYLSENECCKKMKLCQMIMRKCKEYVSDNWLEYVRCLQLNGCFWDQSGVKCWCCRFEETGNRGVRLRNACCSCSYKYDSSTCPYYWQCEMNGVQLEVS